MYLTGYVKKFGKYSFKERPFCDVDAAILATAVYSNLEVVAPSVYDQTTDATLIKNINNFDLSVVIAGRILTHDNVHLLPAMRKSERYGDIGIKYVVKVLDDNTIKQFYACVFIIPDVGNFVAFRGTDSSIIGWKEDLSISINDVMPSQLSAIAYLSYVVPLLEGPVYIGGHSKGGNLALYSIIYSSQEIKDRIACAYSFDGNGLKTNEYYSSKEYLDVKDRIKFFSPYDSFVGELMYNPKTPYVVKSKNLLVFQHDPHSWKINKNTGEFITVPHRSPNSLIRHWAFKEWLKMLSVEDKVLMVETITTVLGGIKQTIFDYFFSTGKIVSLIRILKKTKKDERKRMRIAFKKFSICVKNAKIRYKKGKKFKKIAKNNSDLVSA